MQDSFCLRRCFHSPNVNYLFVEGNISLIFSVELHLTIAMFSELCINQKRLSEFLPTSVI